MALFTDLRVWRQGMDLAVEVYRGTEAFPKSELYGLTQQMRRAAVSIPSNVAEGKGRWSQKEFRQFLFNARGSLLELETQIMIARELGYFSAEESRRMQTSTSRVGRSLAGLLNSLGDSAGSSS
jgi:four helix bundle protein